MVVVVVVVVCSGTVIQHVSEEWTRVAFPQMSCCQLRSERACTVCQLELVAMPLLLKLLPWRLCGSVRLTILLSEGDALGEQVLSHAYWSTGLIGPPSFYFLDPTDLDTLLGSELDLAARIARSESPVKVNNYEKRQGHRMTLHTCGAVFLDSL